MIFIAPSNGSRCEEDLDGISKGLFTILMVISVITSLVAIATITLHLVFKELFTMMGALIMICDRACKNRACGHKLHPVMLQTISQYSNRIFVFCNLQYKAN